MKPLIVLTTVAADFDASSLARELVEARLAACVNILPGVESIYRWEGKVEADGEKLLLIKTSDERLEELERKLLAIHPYEVPEFVVIDPADVRGPYRAWLQLSLS